MKPYHFLTLRYLPDSVAEEFVNIGVVLHAPGIFFGARFSDKITRPKSLFHELDKKNFKSLVSHLGRRFEAIEMTYPSDFLDAGKNIEEIANHILPPDDSAFQWSSRLSGLSADMEQELESLFHRLVTRHDLEKKTHRNDDAVWQTFRQSLVQRRVMQKLTDKVLSAPDYEYEFRHAWKNGKWNLYEPLSFDLEDSQAIVEKGNRWLGRGIALNDSPEDHKFYFLVGEPETDARKRAAQRAMNLIHKIGNGKVEFVKESEREWFADSLAEEIRKHEMAHSGLTGNPR